MTILQQLLRSLVSRPPERDARPALAVDNSRGPDWADAPTRMPREPALDEALRNFEALSAGEKLKQIEEAICTEPPHVITALTKLLQGELNRPFIPFPGPQTQALLSKADVLLYGGAAGGGKSKLLIGAAAEGHKRAIILRREGTELDGLISESKDMLLKDGNKFNGSPDTREWTLKNGASIKFGGMKDADDWRKYAGRARDFIGLDEAAEFLSVQVRSILGWMRSATPGQRTRMILASNPPRGAEGSWIFDWFAPWLDTSFANPAAPGEIRWCVHVGEETVWLDGPGEVEIAGETYTAMSHTFIPARLDDNPALSGTGYRATLQSLPEPLRSQLLKGDFMAGREDDAWQVIPTEWITRAVERWENLNSVSPGPPRGRKMTSVGVDISMGGTDETIIAPRYGNWFAMPIARQGLDTKDAPLMASLVFGAMRDQCMAVVDLGGGWGGEVFGHLKNMDIAVEAFMGINPTVSTTQDGRMGFANLRAETWWKFREALDPNGGAYIALPPEPKMIADLTSARWVLKKGGIQIEDKAEIRKRLGRSPDRGDAVTMAWHYGGLHQMQLEEQRQVRVTANLGYAGAKRGTQARPFKGPQVNLGRRVR